MKLNTIFRYLFLIASIVYLVGCDGHARMIYLKDQSKVEQSKTFSSTTILVKSDENVDAEIEKIALQLSLKKDSQRNIYYKKGFQMQVRQISNGCWEVLLLDWPEFIRSDISIKAEELIRERLEQAQVP